MSKRTVYELPIYNDDNTRILCKNGQFPSMSKGRPKWRVTYDDERQEIFTCWRTMLNHIGGLNVGHIIKIEKKWEKLSANPGDILQFVDMTDWKDVTKYYRKYTVNPEKEECSILILS